MNELDISIDIHVLKLQDWLISRRIAPKNIQSYIKIIRTKITNALLDLPSSQELIDLLFGSKINYYHCKRIVEILKATERDAKSVFGLYSSQRMKDWQEIMRLYEKDNIYLAEASQLFVRNIHYEIPVIRKQMTRLEQQAEECLKRVQDLSRPEAQALHEHAALLQQLGVKGDNLREEFTTVLATLPDLYKQSIQNIGTLQECIDLYAQYSANDGCLPLLRHLIERGNTTVFEYVHKQVPLVVEENVIAINLNDENSSANSDTSAANNDIDFGTDENAGTSSTISAEVIDFGELNLEASKTDAVTDVEIDWGIDDASPDVTDINYDVPVEEYGIVVEGVGVDSGTAKGDEAYTVLDSPTYRDRIQDELYELEAFLKMRLHELNQLTSSANIMFSLMDSISSHDAESIKKMLDRVDGIIRDVCNDRTHLLFQLKHSQKYAELLASKLRQMCKAVEKIRNARKALQQRAVQLGEQRTQLNPVLEQLTKETKTLQLNIEKDISKRYKNRVVNLLGGVH